MHWYLCIEDDSETCSHFESQYLVLHDVSLDSKGMREEDSIKGAAEREEKGKGVLLLPWLFVSWCQSCHIYHGRVVRGVSVWPTRICLCRAPANEFAHAAGTHSSSPHLSCCFYCYCKVIAVLSPGAIMPHLSQRKRE